MVSAWPYSHRSIKAPEQLMSYILMDVGFVTISVMLIRQAIFPVLLLIALLGLACGGAPSVQPQGDPMLTLPPTLTVDPTATAVGPTPEPAVSGPAPIAEPTAVSYDSNRTMYSIWHGPEHPAETTLGALADTEEYGDKSQVVVILEALKFFRNRDALQQAIDTLTVLTGQDFDFDRRQWREWIGPRMEEFAPPSNYPRWKVDSLAVIDPAIGAILEPGITHSRVDLTEVVWGGVRLDGIPPLEQPPHILPEQATWLWPGDRVFGVSINGEHRAYPLRIMNAHELANDALGGEPISLVY